MARKKKTTKKIVPSKYQEDIFDFIQNGRGNLVVEARAGSGKSWTLIKCLDFIDNDKSILLTAFNRDIVSELEKKAKGHDNVTVSTLHSLGWDMLRKNFPDEEMRLDEFKYKSFVSTNIKTLSVCDFSKKKANEFARFINNVNMYVNFGRCYLCESLSDMDFIEARYAIDTIEDEKEVALNVMKWGRENLEAVDYTDMIWLPNVLMCKPIKSLYDWIFLDEGQDLSVCQRAMLLKCRKINTRMCIFGDSEQSLYAFSSADPKSFEELKNMPNTTSLPLSISYRCAEEIIKLAQTIVPSIEYSGDGRVGEIKRNALLDEIEDGDMVLCRNNAPLTKIYVSFIKKGKRCYIRGKDIGLNLKNIVKRTNKEELNADLKQDGVFVRLYDNLFDSINILVSKYNIPYVDAINSAFISNKIDMIKALEILSEGINTASELNEKIKGIFSDRKSGGISLSTVHKAKGLEADNVFIACESLMPSKHAKLEWELKQEQNLIYVAYTRAKNRLSFIAESEIEGFGEPSTTLEKQLKGIEIQVNRVLSKKPIKADVTNPYVARDIIRNATNIEKPKGNTKVLNKPEAVPSADIRTLGAIVRRRITNKKRSIR